MQGVHVDATPIHSTRPYQQPTYSSSHPIIEATPQYPPYNHVPHVSGGLYSLNGQPPSPIEDYGSYNTTSLNGADPRSYNMRQQSGSPHSQSYSRQEDLARYAGQEQPLSSSPATAASFQYVRNTTIVPPLEKNFVCPTCESCC